MSADATSTVFIVDDDAAVREALSMMLRTAGIAVATFASADALLAYDPPRTGGCIVLDVRMPGMSGLELQDRLQAQGSLLPVVFLTGHGDVPMAVHAVKQGAFDFLLKPVDDRRLLATVEAALESSLPPTTDAGTRSPALVASALSKREREVLDRILAGRQSREIADELFVSVKTIEFHRGRIYEKLAVTSLAELFSRCFGAERADPPPR